MGRYELSIDLEGVPPLNSADNRGWRIKKKQKDYWFQLIRAAIGINTPSDPLRAARVTVTRCTSTACDGDNLHHSAKYVLDALMGCRVILDDGPKFIGMVDCRWEKTKRGQPRTRVLVQEINPDEVDSSAWDYGEG